MVLFFKTRKLIAAIKKEEREAATKVWYVRSRMLAARDDSDPGSLGRKRVEKEYPEFCAKCEGMTDFDWGRLSGRLETLRWALHGEKGDLGS